MTIFDLLPEENIFQINQFLREEGFTPWTQEREQKKGHVQSKCSGLESARCFFCLSAPFPLAFRCFLCYN